MKKILSILIPVIVAGCLGYYIGVKSSSTKISIPEKQQSYKDDTTKLLEELSTVMQNPKTTTDTINNFLVKKYGPCWGIPDGQCRE